jgi:hypothetical protein
MVFVLQAKVDLDLPKFELLLSAMRDWLSQVLSSSEEGIPVEFIQSGVERVTPLRTQRELVSRKVVICSALSSSITIKLPLGYFSFLV